MIKKWFVSLLSVTVLILFNALDVYGWCEDGIEIGEYRVGLTSERSSDNHCVKPQSDGKTYSFVLSRIGKSDSCPAFPVIYCNDDFMGEYHSVGDTVTCKEGESIRIAYDDQACEDLANYVEGIVNVTKVIPPAPDSSWIGWVIGGGVGAVVVATVTTGGILCLRKYIKSHPRKNEQVNKKMTELTVTTINPIFHGKAN